jgi:hypothetical protein
VWAEDHEQLLRVDTGGGVVAGGEVEADVVAELAEAVVLVGDASQQLIQARRPAGRSYPGPREHRGTVQCPHV